MPVASSPAGVIEILLRAARCCIDEGASDDDTLQRLEDAVRAQPAAVLFADNDGRYVGANPAASDLTGYSRRQLLDYHVWDVLPSDDEREAEVLWRAFLQTGRQDGDLDILARDGIHVLTRYLALANLVPGLHVSVLTRLSS